MKPVYLQKYNIPEVFPNLLFFLLLHMQMQEMMVAISRTKAPTDAPMMTPSFLPLSPPFSRLRFPEKLKEEYMSLTETVELGTIHAKAV